MGSIYPSLMYCGLSFVRWQPSFGHVDQAYILLAISPPDFMCSSPIVYYIGSLTVERNDKR